MQGSTYGLQERNLTYHDEKSFDRLETNMEPRFETEVTWVWIVMLVGVE